MARFRKWLPVLLGSGLLAACGTLDVAQMPVKGGAFEQGLRDGYVKLADEEYDQLDFSDARGYAERARMSAEGNVPIPEAISARAVGASHRDALAEARARLMSGFARGGAQRAPADASTAQVMFDCWMEQAEEDIQPEDIARCRDGFMVAMARVEAALPSDVAAAPAAAPAPEPSPGSETFVVYFGLDSAKIGDRGMETIRDAVAKANSAKAADIFVTGHADRKGPADYNAELAKKRSGAVLDALVAAGVRKDAIGTLSEGESRPAVETRDGVAEPRNRRVEISVVY